MELVKRINKKKILLARCEKCGREIEIPFTNAATNPLMPSIDLKEVVRCECGEYHNLIIDTKKHRVVTTSPSRYQEESAIKCPRCGSDRIHTGDKGFGLGKSLVGRVLFGPIGYLGGFIGHKKIMITCLKCGYKWEAGKE